MADTVARKPARILHDLQLSEDAVRAHVLHPEHLAAGRTLHEELRFSPRRITQRLSLLYRFNVAKFGQRVQAALGRAVAGYALQMRRNGRVILEQRWNWACTPDDGKIGWTADVPIHLASVSKLITAMALTKLLDDTGISLHANIATWLPAYWAKGPQTQRITFEHVLTHTSGLGAGITPCDFSYMKAQIAAGTSTLGIESYQNVNFGLCRILIATLTRAIPMEATYNVLGKDVSDQFWDLVTIKAYERYVRQALFAPAGVTAPTLEHPSATALAYLFPVETGGWDSGGLGGMSGAVGWHMSVNDLLAVMGMFRRSGEAMSPAAAQAMLDGGFGIDLTHDTKLGRLYGKGGFWVGPGGQVEQSAAYFLPGGIELAILVNSQWQSGAFFSEVPGIVDACVDGIFRLPFASKRLPDIMLPVGPIGGR